MTATKRFAHTMQWRRHKKRVKWTSQININIPKRRTDDAVGKITNLWMDLIHFVGFRTRIHCQQKRMYKIRATMEWKMWKFSKFSQLSQTPVVSNSMQICNYGSLSIKIKLSIIHSSRRNLHRPDARQNITENSNFLFSSAADVVAHRGWISRRCIFSEMISFFHHSMRCRHSTAATSSLEKKIYFRKKVDRKSENWEISKLDISLFFLCCS